MNYLNAISQSIIYKYSKTWFITNMQGCYAPKGPGVFWIGKIIDILGYWGKLHTF